MSALGRPHTIRSWLGGRSTDPHNFTLHFTHPPTEGLTMRKRSLLTVPVAALAVIALGLTVGATLPEQGVDTPTPPTSFAAPVTALAEDDPGWDCEIHGNRICGPGGPGLDTFLTSTAWHTFDAAGGAQKLRVDPSREFRVDFVGYAVQWPELDVYDLALPGADGKWYVFKAVYTS